MTVGAYEPALTRVDYASAAPTEAGGARARTAWTPGRVAGHPPADGADRVELSPAARLDPEKRAADTANGFYGADARTARQWAVRQQLGLSPAEAEPSAEAAGTDPEKDAEPPADASRPRGADGEALSDEDARLVRDLQATDRHVRQHEQAHVAAGGPYVTHGAQYEYTEGPDGQRYAVAGEVGIDTSPERDPSATIRKMQTVRAAALAPSDPSGQDRSVAAAAAQTESRARVELREQKSAETEEPADESAGASAEEETATEPAAPSTEPSAAPMPGSVA